MDLTDKEHVNILFPQWQGSGPDNILFYGAKTILDHLYWLSFYEVPVPREKKLSTKNNILGYEDILAQAADCRALIDKHHPWTLLTIGGDCGVEPVPVSYLNHRLSGDLAL
ncbi:MAG: arginase family protein, partial [bacterium]|nr:arginase family protein [bacterium]